jgi:hypothetical protein
MTQEQITALANGMAVGSVSGNSTPTIIVNQGNGSNPQNCLSCDDASCEVTPSTAVAMDLGSFKFSQGAKVRFNRIFNNSGSAVSLPLFASWTFGIPQQIDRTRFPGAVPNLDAITGIPAVNLGPPPFVEISDIPGFSIDGQGIRPMQYMATILSGGAVVASVVLQADTAQGVGTANSEFINANLELIHYPVDFHNPAVSRVVYDPFCDACFTQNNGTTVTHRYTVSAPITWRDGLNIIVPDGASNVVVEFCFAIIDVPNTNADNASKQMP